MNLERIRKVILLISTGLTYSWQYYMGEYHAIIQTFIITASIIIM